MVTLPTTACTTYGVRSVVKFVLVLFLVTPQYIRVVVPAEYDTLQMCRKFGDIAAAWSPGWFYACIRVVDI